MVHRCSANLNLSVMPCLLPKDSSTDSKTSCDLRHDQNFLLRQVGEMGRILCKLA